MQLRAKEVNKEEVLDSGGGSTERVRLARQRCLEAQQIADPSRAYLLTEWYKKTEGKYKPTILRKAEALRHIFENIPVAIREGELIVGVQSKYIRGGQLFPDIYGGWMVDEFNKSMPGETGTEGADASILGTSGGSLGTHNFATVTLYDHDREMTWEAIDYWKDKGLEDIVPDYLKIFWGEENYEKLKLAREVQFVSQSLREGQEGRNVADYQRVLNEGLNGIISASKEKLNSLGVLTSEDYEKACFYRAIITALQGVIEWAKRYAAEAKRLAQAESDDKRKKELEEISEICEWVPANPARTFREAVQSYWFIFLAPHFEIHGQGNSPGRFDQYIYPFYKADIEGGKISREEALELLELLTIKHTEMVSSATCPYYSGIGGGGGHFADNMILGGCTADGEDASNEISLLMMDAILNTRTVSPLVNVRWNNKLNEDFLKKTVEMIKAGFGMPALYGDDVAISHFTSYCGASLEDARDWSLGGCVEMSLGQNSGSMMLPAWVNAAKGFELALNNGVDPVTGKQVGPETGNTEDMTNIEELKEAFGKQSDYAIRLIKDYFGIQMSLYSRMLPPILASAFTNDCIEKGKTAMDGGARYHHSSAMLVAGMIDVANSLAAIKKCVFDDKLFSIKELKEALKADFKGESYEWVQKKLLEAPKFGNDDDYVDSIAVELYKDFVEDVYRYQNWQGQGHTHMPTALSVGIHGILGKFCGALPEGRNAGVALSDASLSPHGGTDIKGPTAVIRSATKIDSVPFQATQLNMKFHPGLLRGKDGSRGLLSLLKTYFDMGGYHIQFNVVDVKTLKDAQEHPEKNRNLIVRVAGFCAYFVELGPQIQEEIIRRTEWCDF